MENSGKYENRIQKVVQSFDAFTAAYSVMLLLFFIPYVIGNGQYVAAAFVPIGCLLPFALMPLMYSVVHRFVPLLFGRYHLIMPLSAFVAALFFVLFWSADGGVGGGFIVVFCSAITVFASVLYRYCSFSIRTRTADDGIMPSVRSLILVAIGGASAVGAIAGFSVYDRDTALLNSAYVIAALDVILVMVQYLSSFYFIPELGGKRVMSVKSVFGSFYCGLHKRTYFSALLFIAAYAVLATAIVPLSGAATGIWYVPIVAAGVIITAFAAASAVCAYAIKHRSRALTIAVFAFLAVAAIFIAITKTVAFNAGSAAAIAVVVIGSLCIGIGGALALRQTYLRFLTVKSHLTSGMVYILAELAVCAAIAIAVAVALSIGAAYGNNGDVTDFIYSTVAAAALGIAALVTSTVRTATPANSSELAYEPNEEDVPSEEGDYADVSADVENNINR